MLFSPLIPDVRCRILGSVSDCSLRMAGCGLVISRSLFSIEIVQHTPRLSTDKFGTLRWRCDGFLLDSVMLGFRSGDQLLIPSVLNGRLINELISMEKSDFPGKRMS